MVKFRPPKSVQESESVTLSEYQKQALTTAISNHESVNVSDTEDLRFAFGIVGEAGEIAETHKKFLRGDFDYFEFQERVARELGDLLWYVAVVADRHDMDLGDVAAMNLDKLSDRKERGTL